MIDAYWYHTLDLPGIGTVGGEWDLRGKEREYLGGIDVRGLTCLDIGTASGALAFYLESAGAAAVTAADIGPSDCWDSVPFGGTGRQRPEHISRLNESFRVAHEALNSRVKNVRCSAYGVDSLGERYNVVVMGAILRHLRDPFLAMQRAAAVCDKHLVITQRVLKWRLIPGTAKFLPRPDKPDEDDSWWLLPEGIVSDYVKILGLSPKVSRHTQICHGKPIKMFTVVGHRDKDV